MASRIVYRENGEAWFAVEATDDVLAPAHSPLRGGKADSVKTTIRDAGEIIAQTAKDILGPIQESLEQAAPGNVELTFGIKLGTEGNLPMVMKASGEATFEVKLCWNTDGK